eukprot:12914233-Prorocentrum_lima.AAC.1
MARSGPDSSFRAGFISMRAHVVHDLVKAHLLSVLYVASQEDPADARTKGWELPLTRRPGFRSV